jgi:two-component system, OmpR family, response regulator
MDRICKVLVVEDDRYVRELLATVFADEGYHFTLVANGGEMRRVLANDQAIDIIVIDVTLPGENGLSLARHAAAEGYGVILVSGDHSHYDAIETSGHRFLFKPFRIDSLLQLIEAVLAEAANDCKRLNAGPQPKRIELGP